MEKCCLGQNQLRFLCHLVDQSGVRTDPDKVEAIHQLPLPLPGNVQELKRARTSGPGDTHSNQLLKTLKEC